jgi:TPR repeat protein
LGYFKVAAEPGNAIGPFNYGVRCYTGKDSCVDFIEAFEHFKESSDQNYPPAHIAIGVCLQLGRGIPLDVGLARHYFSLANEAGW